MRFVVASLDVVGNEDDGWDVNDQHQIGTIDIAEEALEDDHVIIDCLHEGGYAVELAFEDVYISGDNDHIVLEDWDSGRPLLALIAQQ